MNRRLVSRHSEIPNPRAVSGTLEIREISRIVKQDLRIALREMVDREIGRKNALTKSARPRDIMGLGVNVVIAPKHRGQASYLTQETMTKSII